MAGSGSGRPGLTDPVSKEAFLETRGRAAGALPLRQGFEAARNVGDNLNELAVIIERL
jgi:hypothetical protein